MGPLAVEVVHSFPLPPPPLPPRALLYRSSGLKTVLTAIMQLQQLLRLTANCCVAQVVGSGNPNEVLTALRELPESVSRDQDRLVPLVAEVVRDSEPSSFRPSPPLLLTFLLFFLAHVQFTKYLLLLCLSSSSPSFSQGARLADVPCCRSC